ncbi:unnamed protein product [Ilex paraguariensis]|uniref:non-specific serine/threonine protein kinase n=1 Tax=Ilex paraguariensis TaxID=185542 RepID=A0ABC8UCG5_9AQUA
MAKHSLSTPLPQGGGEKKKESSSRLTWGRDQKSTVVEKKKMMNEFEYEELEAATENFSPSNMIGKGGHGQVYKGILKDGRLVAIKKQSLGLEKLQDGSKLNNEVRILSKLPPNNPYTINLVGLSQLSHGPAKSKVLVMEHMPNGTLHHLLHVASQPPPWPKRAQIAIQIARAVQFLHESKPMIIHRDIKSANILFDSSWNAKLADFGLSLNMNDHDSVSQPVNSWSRPAGTIGYLDPCYTTPSKLSTKNDVFSFGVVLLEIISSTKAIDVSRAPAAMVEWALPLIEEDQVEEICDKRIAVPRYMEGTIRQLLRIAASCVCLEEDHRPSMGKVVIEMENCIVDQPVQFPIWMNMNLLHSLVTKKWWKRAAKRCRTTIITAKATAATTTIICAATAEEVNGGRSSSAVRKKQHSMLLIKTPTF